MSTCSSCFKKTVFAVLATVLIISATTFKAYEQLITDLNNSKPCAYCDSYSYDYSDKRLCCDPFFIPQSGCVFFKTY